MKPYRTPIKLKARFSDTTQINNPVNIFRSNSTGARFTKYLTTILLLIYDNAKVTIDL